MKTALCFIAIIPDSEIYSEVKAFQEYVSENFESNRALRAPPHITLEPPFKWEVDRFQELESILDTFAKKQSCFSINLQNFNAFPPRVVFVDVAENKALDRFHGAIKSRLRSMLEFRSERQDRPFRPHMTIAFRDLRRQMFHQAWAYFSGLEYKREFVADQFCLLQHNGERWEARTVFKFDRA